MMWYSKKISTRKLLDAEPEGFTEMVTKGRRDSRFCKFLLACTNLLLLMTSVQKQLQQILDLVLSCCPSSSCWYTTFDSFYPLLNGVLLWFWFQFPLVCSQNLLYSVLAQFHLSPFCPPRHLLFKYFEKYE